MKLVLDTNVIVSGLLTAHGHCARILDLVAEGVLLVCIDPRLLAVFGEVLHRTELDIAPADAAIVLDMLRGNAQPVVALPLAAALPDPDDLPFLEVAAAADAILVTGNMRHFPARARGGVSVVTPRELIEILARVRPA